MSDVYEQSVELHKNNRGKLEIKSKVPLNTKEDLSLAYTPGVSEVCRLIAKDKSAALTHTMKGNMIAVVSDGSAILGLGNLGPEAAIPVMEGKCILFKEFAGVDAFPICLDTQDTEEIIKTVKYLAPNFGGINLEDISAPRCFEIEERLKAELNIPVMHDDQHGTALVVLAGLINAIKLRGLTKDDAQILINGAGAAGLAITDLLLNYGFKNIVVCDSKGSIYEGRSDLNDAKIKYAKLTNQAKINAPLVEAIKNKDIFVGVSLGGVLSEEMVSSMNERPIVFALANPTPEIMPEAAKRAGAYIVATGRSDFPNQLNNVLAFPGIFRGALDNKVTKITDLMLTRAAEKLSALVSEPNPELILPNPFDKEISKTVASAIY
jgi:malate dehydrogenase (oxaloacetate-decarboxylating)